MPVASLVEIVTPETINTAAPDSGLPKNESRRDVRPKTVARVAGVLLAIGLFALVALVATAFVINQRAEKSFDALLAARNLSSAADGLRTAVQSAEASQRGYLITGNEIYLAPYATQKAAADRYAQTLRSALQGNEDVQPSLAHLDKILAVKFDEMDEVIGLTRDARVTEARALVQTNRGKSLMDEANVFMSRYVRLGDAQLRTAAADQNRWLNVLRIVNTAAALLIGAVVAAVVWIVWRYAQAARESREAVEVLNADLEQRVVERTADLAAARDRAEMLMAEVNHRVANSLTLVASMVRLQARRTGDETSRRLLNEVHDRVSAVGLVHRRLYVSKEVRSVDLSEFLSSLVGQLAVMLQNAGQRDLLKQDFEAIEFPTDKSVSLGVIAAELVTNAFKYAYPDGAGEIRVRLERAGQGMAVLTVADDGVGMTKGDAPQGTGLGSQLVAAMIANLDGLVEYLDGKPGTIARVTFPV